MIIACKMNAKKRTTGAKPKTHGGAESGSDKKNQKSDNHGTNGNRPKFANNADTAAKKFSPHLPDKVAMQLLEKGSVLRVCKTTITKIFCEHDTLLTIPC